MFRNTLRGFAVFVFVSAASAAFAQDQDLCKPILDHGIDDITARASKFAYANYIKDNLCQIDWEKMNLNQQSEASAFASFFSGSESFSTQQQKFKWACENYKRDTTVDMGQAQLTVSMHDKAIEAWSRCRENSQKQLYIRFLIPNDSLDLDVLMSFSGYPSPTTFRGISSEGFQCKRQDKPVSAHESTPLSTKEEHLHCTRLGHVQNIGGEMTTYYPPTTLMVMTDSGNEWVEFVERTAKPMDGRFAKDEALIQGVNFKLDQLKNSLRKSSENEKDYVRIDEHHIDRPLPVHPDSDTTHTFEQMCPSGTFAVGIKTWGEAAGGDCDGCVAKTQIICKKLSVE